MPRFATYAVDVTVKYSIGLFNEYGKQVNVRFITKEYCTNCRAANKQHAESLIIDKIRNGANNAKGVKVLETEFTKVKRL